MMPVRRKTLTTLAIAVSVALGFWLAIALERAAGQQPGAAPQAGQPGAQFATAGRHVPFDIQERPGEHPLMRLIRVGEESLGHIDQNVNDYQCLFQKQERIDGELQDIQLIDLVALHKPFSVYLKFRQPSAGREVIYVEGQNDGNLIALDGGWKRNLGKMNLDPEGMVAMKGQKHPITMIGIRNLLTKILEFSKADTQFGECDVQVIPNFKLFPNIPAESRDTTAFVITHPQPRQNFHYHKVQVFFDNELRVPIHFVAYLWPAAPGQQPPLEETYTYRQLKINTGVAPNFFDANNPQLFQ